MNAQRARMRKKMGCRDQMAIILIIFILTKVMIIKARATSSYQFKSIERVLAFELLISFTSIFIFTSTFTFIFIFHAIFEFRVCFQHEYKVRHYLDMFFGKFYKQMISHRNLSECGVLFSVWPTRHNQHFMVRLLNPMTLFSIYYLKCCKYKYQFVFKISINYICNFEDKLLGLFHLQLDQSLIQMAQTPEDAPQIEAGNEDVTALNQELIDRLRILNYEKQYVSKGNKPINLATFSVATNPTEQFNTFKNLVKYLFQLNDVKADYSQYDQPMTVSGNIIKECQKLQIPCDFPPLKLKTGSGDQVLLVLNGLAGKAMKKKNFNFKKPTYEKASDVEQQKQDQQKPADDNQQMIDDVEVAEDDDLDDKQQVGAAVLDEDKQIIHSNVSENDWKLQCERVANKLKVQAKTDNKQWRARIQSTRASTDFVKKNFPNARSILQKLNDQLTSTLDKISKSQRMINSNMSEVGDQYKNQSQELKKLSSHFNNLSTAMKEMNENYRLISEKLQQIQAKTNEHSGTMTDTSPVVKIKQALKNMQTEIKSMDVRLGVLNHTVLQYKSKERNQDKKLRNLQAEEFDDLE